MSGREADSMTLLTSWHLRQMWRMPAAFWRVRRLERQCRAAPGCEHVHRWVSRRSLLLVSRWRTPADAEAWLASLAFRSFDGRMRAYPGCEARAVRLAAR